MNDQLHLKATSGYGLTPATCEVSSFRHMKRTTSLMAGVAMGVSLALLGTASAQAAGYSVGVQTSARAAHAGATTCSYNYGGTGCSPTDAGRSGSVAPSTYVAPGATQASATAHQDGPSSLPGVNTSATTAVSADLSTASLHLYGSDTGFNGNYTGSANTNSTAVLSDTLHFTVAGANDSTVTAIGVIFTLDGRMYQGGTSLDGTSSGEISGGLNFGGSDARFDLVNYGFGYGASSTGGLTKVNYLDTYPIEYPGLWTTNTDHTVNTFTESYNIVGASADIAFGLNALLLCANGMICDYGNTAKFALSLPTGTSFTSDSGVFLTGGAPVGGVPEPASWAMMLVGFGGLGAVLRRQRRRRVIAFAK
jgi:hypothetical protein